jgi:hypothetical protein
MARKHIEIDPPALALRRAEAAAALGLSVETFDQHVRPHVPAVRLGGVVIYPVAGLVKWLDREQSVISEEVRP